MKFKTLLLLFGTVFIIIISHNADAFLLKKITPQSLENQLNDLEDQLKNFQTPTKKIKEHLISLSPTKNKFTIQTQFTLSGKTNKIKHLFINGSSIPITNTFKYILQLPSANTHTITLTFITEDNTYFQKTRYITKLISPPDINYFKGNKEHLIKAYNSPLLRYPINIKPLRLPLTRSELSKMLSDQIGPVKIDRSIEQDWLSQYPNQNNYPSSNVSNLQFYISLLKRLEITPSNKPQTETKIIPSHHWAKYYLNAAINYEIISPDTWFRPYQPISLGSALSSIIRYHPFKNSDPIYSPKTPQIQKQITSKITLLEYLNSTQKKGYKELVFDTLKNNQFYPTANIIIKGHILPAIPFKINKSIIYPKSDGIFEHSYRFSGTIATITVTAFEKVKYYTLFQTPFYNDLNDHWIKNTVLKLQYLGLIQPTQNFKPKSTFSLRKFIQFSRPFLAVLNTTKSTSFSPSLMALSSGNIEQLLPDESISLTKAETLSLIIPQITTANIAIKLPYWDVPKSYWAQQFIRTAYSLKLISESNQFYPDQPMTKAELTAILAKIPHVKTQLEKRFNQSK